MEKFRFFNVISPSIFPGKIGEASALSGCLSIGEGMLSSAYGRLHIV
jgi:hypothetical protein